MPPTQTDLFTSSLSSSAATSDIINNKHDDEVDSLTSELDAVDSVDPSVSSPSSSASSSSSATLDAVSPNNEPGQAHKETIIAFDWDDTLLSSSWLASLGYRLDSNMSSAPTSLIQQLAVLATTVIALLRLAHQHGRVVVVTNAETGWVELSAQKFFPSVFPVLNELNITIFSARSTFESTYPDSPLKWKSAAFEHILNETTLTAEQLSQCSTIIHKNVISLGDSHVEREAVRNVTSEMMNTLCKSVKFAERPTCDQLVRQLNLVTSCFNYILTHQNHLDLQLTVTVNDQNEQQAKDEEEKMRCHEQSLMSAHDDGCGGPYYNNNAAAAAAASICMDQDFEQDEKLLDAF